jgi:hypothetical protein
MSVYILFFALLVFSAKTLLGWKLAMLFAAGSLLLFFPGRPAIYMLTLFISTFFIKRKPELKFKVVYFVSYGLLLLLFVWFDKKINVLLALPTALGIAMIAVYQYKDSKETALSIPDQADMTDDL